MTPFCNLFIKRPSYVNKFRIFFSGFVVTLSSAGEESDSNHIFARNKQVTGMSL